MEQTQVSQLIAENTKRADDSPDTFWLLTFSYEYEDDVAMMERQSLHHTKAASIRRMFDHVYELYESTPDQTEVWSHTTREDGADFADIYVAAKDAPIGYSIVPLEVQQ